MAPLPDLLPDLLPDTATVPFARDLAGHGDRPAIITADGEMSYRALAARVADTAQRLGRHRRLVLLAGANTVDAVVVYLAALAAGHPVLLVPGDNPAAMESLIAAYDPDVVAGPTDGRWQVDERRAISTHALHPDLALLLSTSGSTGSPKLVRVSYDNVRANAEAIAEYLDIRPGDRAATTLPMHYCYGLSVINSHLARGAGLILTELSVADACFWELFRDRRGTTFAGVPYTFELLDRVGFAAMRLPHLRYVTQAGGRLAPDRVRHWATVGRRDGWDLFVMYGQTEATARMAYLPPELAASHPEAIGVPVPGGAFRLAPLPDHPDPEAGELVYTGPNVMLGYAETRADLGLGRTVDELRTGDIARRTPDGLYELIGRRSRFAKILGVRIDPQRVEAALDRHGLTTCCVGADDELIVAVQGGDGDVGRVRRLVVGECGAPARAVRVCFVTELPRLPTGKPDHVAVRELARTAGAPAPRSTPAPAPGPVDLCRLYAELLDRDDVTPDSSFVSLGGDSLSYVEMSLRLEQALGRLPVGWHALPIRELRQPPRPARTRGRALETSVALRAVAIVLIVGSHIPLFTIKGGAHVLLGLAGFNFARFHLTDAKRRQRVRHVAGSVARIAVPSMTWIALALLATDDYRLTNVFLLNHVLGPRDGRSEWHFWFIEALVAILLTLAAVMALPFVDRLERRIPFGLPMALMTAALVARYDIGGLRPDVPISSPVVVFWLFALGWAAGKATERWQRLAVSVAVLATVPSFFGAPEREALIIAGLWLLVWVPSLPSLPALNRAAGVLAGSSLYIYLVHWQVYPRLDEHSKLLALLASLALGIGYARVAASAAARVSAALRPLRERAGRVVRRARTSFPVAGGGNSPAGG
ncbi:Acyl-CoA synthetase (AMP-forming)/AMP-acid ligase II [Micromonospora pattaloongensis]|uniref:Acyl-CoA synthetase (AMP-forming)/AMP-acid ligase II n=1 Tax=Micromonospora pattaloongensis TaxID=405436 RepID=A0A1H3QVV0_9ACTN|nr:AMP-binding protein [Micromonospora pattaloongensis]SDZ16839.1 Acyl-CoA synthetase (AMP-forming)/AMP-acid ligase II [Micromonospora pattaloongensis]